MSFWARNNRSATTSAPFSPIRGGEAYRVWGELGSATRVELQIYAGRPWDGSGRSAGYLTFEEIEIASDGSFEIWVTPEEHEGNWLRNPPEGTTLFARQAPDALAQGGVVLLQGRQLG